MFDKFSSIKEQHVVKPGYTYVE